MSDRTNVERVSLVVQAAELVDAARNISDVLTGCEQALGIFENLVSDTGGTTKSPADTIPALLTATRGDLRDTFTRLERLRFVLRG